MMNKRLSFVLKGMGFLGLMGILFYCTQGWAATNSIFKHAADTLRGTFVQARRVVYVCGGFGLIGVAVGGIFGRISFKWLAMIAIALATLAGADYIVNYATAGKAVEAPEVTQIGYGAYNISD